MFGIILSGFLILIVTYYLYVKSSPLDALPGPLALPFIGNIHLLDKNRPYVSLHKLSKQVGGFFKFVFFSKTRVIVCDPKSIYLVLVKQSSDFAGRPNFFRADLFNGNHPGIALTDFSPEQKARRKLVQAYLRQFGSGMKRIEDVTMVATDDMMQRIMKKNGQPFDIHRIFFHCITDVIVIMLRGEVIEDASELQTIHMILDKLFKGLGNDLAGEALDAMPFLRHFGNKRYKLLKGAVQAKNAIIAHWFKDNPENGLINHINTLTAEDKAKNGLHELGHQLNTAWEFFGGGIYTTSSTLCTLTNVLAHLSDVQNKLRMEVVSVVGNSRPPSMKDRDEMPYHKATILEIGRFASITPLAIPHKTLRDTDIGGYMIPKDTEVLVNIWSMHHDDDIWDEPYEFKPERFLDENGLLVDADHPNRKNLMPFGAGARVCVGEILATSRIFLILSRLVQNFVIEPETSVKAQPSMDPRDMQLGIALLPPTFKVRLRPVQ